MLREEKFYADVFEKISDYYNGKAKVTIHDVTKNNSLSKRGLCVTMIGGNCGPTIYLDDFYEEYQDGRPFELVIKDIIKVLDEHLVEEKVDFSFITDFDKIYDKICYRLVGSKTNKKKLEGCPHRLIEDLAVTYFVSLVSMGIEGSVAIRKELMDIWKVTEEDLFEAAMDNTPRIYPANIIPMNDFLKKQTGHDFFADAFLSEGFLIGSNTKYTHGATVILYPGLLKEVGEHFGGNYYIIPSSVNEVLFVKELFCNEDPETLENMIKSVNASCVLPEDVLSDYLYYYDREAQNIIKKVEQVKDTMLL